MADLGWRASPSRLTLDLRWGHSRVAGCSGVASIFTGLLGKVAFSRLWVPVDLSDTQSFLPDSGWVLKGCLEQARNRGCGGVDRGGALEMLLTP